MPPPVTSSITPDIAGLRALSHPVRLRMLGLLRSEGPATATSLARDTGLITTIGSVPVILAATLLLA